VHHPAATSEHYREIKISLAGQSRKPAIILVSTKLLQ
jgi:hypothetical protein